MIPVLAPTPENLQRAAEALRRGELVGMPTETVYGLAADARNPSALARVFEVKQRPFFDPLIVHIAETSDLDDLCHVSQEAEILMGAFWPGPLTLVLAKKESVPDLATSGLPSVAVRMPAHPVARALLRAAGLALAAPSANPFGGLSPTTAEHVAAAFATGIDCVLDGGPCEIGVESTVVGWENGEARLLRAGGIPLEAIEKALGKKVLPPAPAGEAGEAQTGPQLSPGALPWHYAPRTPLKLLETGTMATATPGDGNEDTDTASLPLSARAGLITFGPEAGPSGRIPAGVNIERVENLSPAGRLDEAAANLFAALHRMDGAGLDVIYAPLVPETGLGRAINDRLRKAAAKKKHET